MHPTGMELVLELLYVYTVQEVYKKCTGDEQPYKTSDGVDATSFKAETMHNAMQWRSKQHKNHF